MQIWLLQTAAEIKRTERKVKTNLKKRKKRDIKNKIKIKARFQVPQKYMLKCNSQAVSIIKLNRAKSQSEHSGATVAMTMSVRP